MTMMFLKLTWSVLNDVQMAVERVQGISRLEQLCEELSEEERAKELKQEKKRQKRKNKRKNKCGFEQEAEGEKDKILDEVMTHLLCVCYSPSLWLFWIFKIHLQ